jgi:hypothetical protein
MGQRRWRGGLLATLILVGLGATATGVLALRSVCGVPLAGWAPAPPHRAAPLPHS